MPGRRMDMENRKIISNKKTEKKQGGKGECAGIKRSENGLSWKERVAIFRPRGSDSPSCPTCKGANDKEKSLFENKGVSRDAENMLIWSYRKVLALTPLYKELGFSGYKGGKTKAELKREGLAREVKLPKNRRGRSKVLLQITPKGTEYLKSLGIAMKRKGRGGVKHLYYQKVLKEWYELRGYTVEVEATVGDTSFDVLVIMKNGERLGIEIALSEQYEEVNARKAMQSGIERFMFVCETEEMMERLRRRLGSLIEKWPGSKPGFKLVSDYLADK